MSKPRELKPGDKVKALATSPFIEKGQTYEVVGHYEHERLGIVMTVKQPGFMLEIKGIPRRYFKALPR